MSDDVKHSVWTSRHGIAVVRVEETCTWRDERGDDHEAVAYRYQVAGGWGPLYVIGRRQFVARFERSGRPRSTVDGEPESEESQMRGGAA